jgi:hypothetical protein
VCIFVGVLEVFGLIYGAVKFLLVLRAKELPAVLEHNLAAALDI